MSESVVLVAGGNVSSGKAAVQAPADWFLTFSYTRARGGVADEIDRWVSAALAQGMRLDAGYYFHESGVTEALNAVFAGPKKLLEQLSGAIDEAVSAAKRQDPDGSFRELMGMFGVR